MRLARRWARRDRSQLHDLHQPLHPLAINRVTLSLAEPMRHLAAPEKRRLEMLLIDHSHQPDRFAVVEPLFVIHRRAIQAQELALPPHRQRSIVAPRHHTEPCSHRLRRSASDKKSRSIVSSPTFFSSSSFSGDTGSSSRFSANTPPARSSNCFFHA